MPYLSINKHIFTVHTNINHYSPNYDRIKINLQGIVAAVTHATFIEGTTMNKSKPKSIRILLSAIAVLMLIAAGLIFYSLNTPINTYLSSEQSDSELTITALPVGKADSFIIQIGSHSFMIDTGEKQNQSQILDALSSRNINSLDFIIVTHFDKDHAGCVKSITDQIETDCIYIPDYVGSNKAYTDTMDSKVKKIIVSKDTSLSLGNLSIDIYPPVDSGALTRANLDKNQEIDNDLSLVTSIRYNDCSFLFAADVEKLRINEMLSSDIDWHHNWIKLPHHGDYQKAKKKLIEATNPEYAIITCSDEEAPKKKLIELLDEKNIKKYATTEGEIITTCDGININIEIK